MRVLPGPQLEIVIFRTGPALEYTSMMSRLLTDEATSN